MAQKEQISVSEDRAKYRCPPGLQDLIDLINKIDARTPEDWKEWEKMAPGVTAAEQQWCKAVHEVAQMATLPVDWREDYRKAVVGTPEEWDRFCRDLSGCLGHQVELWRRWPGSNFTRFPTITMGLAISPDGRINSPDYDGSLSMIGIDAKRLKECRHCQRIFWATRIDMVACGKRCAGNLRAKTFRRNRGIRKRRK